MRMMVICIMSYNIWKWLWTDYQIELNVFFNVQCDFKTSKCIPNTSNLFIVLNRTEKGKSNANQNQWKQILYYPIFAILYTRFYFILLDAPWGTGLLFSFKSVNTVVVVNYPIEFLNSMKFSGLAPTNLQLQVCSVIM